MIKFQFIKNLSIKNKIIAIILFVSLTVISVGFAFFATWDLDRIKAETQSNLILDVKLIGDYCVVPLTFDDNRQAHEALSRLKYLESVEAGFLFDKTGNLFAKYPDTLTVTTIPAVSDSPTAIFIDGYFTISEPVHFQGKMLGNIIIKANSKSLEVHKLNLAFIIASIILVLVLLSYLLAVRMQKFISVPIVHLKKHFNMIAITHDYSARVIKPYNDETGNLYDGFNDLLKTVEKQNMDLKDSESHYRLLFEQNPIPVLIYQIGNLNILAVNDAFVAHYGYSKTEATALRLTDLYPESEKKAIADLSQNLHGHAYVGEWHHLKKNGIHITIEARSHGFSFGGRAARIAVINDITERKQAEEALMQSESRYRQLLGSITDYIYSVEIVNGHPVRTTHQPGCESVTGYSPADFESDPILWLKMVHPDDQKIVEHYSDPLCKGKEILPLEHRLIHKNGSVIWVSNTYVLKHDANNNLIGYDGLISNITKRKQVEEELKLHKENLERLVKQRTIELEFQKERAESADRLKSAFLATMSHELRTPLNSIIGFTGILIQGLAGPLNNEQSKQLGMVQNSAHHLLALINDVLDISKIEAGQLEVTIKSYDFQKSIDKIISSIRPLAERKGLEVLTNISAGVGELMSDSRRVEQILLNLLNNAIKFTEKGSITIKCELVDKTLVTRITDTGIGIRDEDMEKLFRPFSQVDTGTTRTHEGTGLGLSICKKLVEKLGGRITVQSKLGIGSTFNVILPLGKG